MYFLICVLFQDRKRGLKNRKSVILVTVERVDLKREAWKQGDMKNLLESM